MAACYGQDMTTHVQRGYAEVMLVEATDLVKTYGSGGAAVQALHGASLSVRQGEFVAIMGASGCGKSTLLAMLGALDTPDSGDVRIGGKSLLGLNDDALTNLRRTTIGFVFQSFNLLPVLTATENVALPLLLGGRPAVDAARRAEEALQLVGLGHRLTHVPRQLSGGEQQRVAIARAIVTSPAVILADEPTGSLDSHNTQDVLRAFSDATRSRQQTVVLITHDAAVAAWADRVVFMRDGRLVGEWDRAAADAGAAESVAAIVATHDRLRRGAVSA